MVKDLLAARSIIVSQTGRVSAQNFDRRFANDAIDRPAPIEEGALRLILDLVESPTLDIRVSATTSLSPQ